MNMKLRGKLYNFFPVEIDTDDNESCKDIECWQWTFFSWWFDLSMWVSGMLYSQPAFPVKIDTKILDNLPTEEKEKLGYYD